MLICKNLNASYFYSKFQKEVLTNVSICLKKGEFVCLAGPNGSGKSSLLKILAGLEGSKKDSLRITSAEIEPVINEIIKIHNLRIKEKARHIAFMEQDEKSAWDSSVLDTILTGRFAWSGTNYTAKDLKIAKSSAETLNITNLLERNIYSLSGGEFQKVRIARSLAQNPEYLLLDEPCSGLDLSYEPLLLETLKKIAHERNIGILISIHNLNLAARFADKIILLPPKKASIAGNPEEIITPENLLNTYGTKMEIFKHPILNIPQIL